MTQSPRILLYSHDTFGLGHIRRNRKIAGALAAAFDNPRIVIATGSPLADSYRPQSGVSLAHLPAVTKRPDGSYGSADPSVPIEKTIEERRNVLAAVIEDLRPDLAIADKEAAGLLGELEPMLPEMKSCGTRMVLGLRDVLDDPALLIPEWEKNGTAATIEDHYDAIWIYGPADFHDPLAGLGLPHSTTGKQEFVGYLPFDPGGSEPGLPAGIPDEFMLVTTGGGGDGSALLKAVFAAAETGDGFPLPLVILPGPYLDPALGKTLDAAARRLGGITLLDFDPESEKLMAAAQAVIAMCGYNTFCETLQLDKPTLFVPRESPRREQLIRARRGSELGLCRYLRIADAGNPGRLHKAIDDLASAPRPSASEYKPNFDAVANIARAAKELLGCPVS